MALASPLPASAHAGSDARTIGVIGLAHFGSHFMLLALAPLLPLMKDDFNVSFTELGLLLTLFFATSGAGQVAAGMLVDRLGAHRLLLAGIVVQATAVVAMGFAPSFLMMFPLVFVSAVGNTVYHPADLSILSRRVTSARHGRAFAAHAMSGSFGFAMSPIAVGFAATVWGWRGALVAAGLFGLAVAVVVALNLAAIRTDEGAGRSNAARGSESKSLSFLAILSLPIVRFGFGFFFLSALAMSGLMNFDVAALTEGYGVDLSFATIVVAMLQFGAIGGTLVGGFVADRVGNHGRVAITGMLGAAACALPIAHTGLPLPLILVLMTLVGGFVGLTLPSRDLLVRRAAPAGNLGKTFGSVYAGLDGGSLLGPLLIGPVLDHGAPQLLFVIAAIGFCLATLTVGGIRRTSSA